MFDLLWIPQEKRLFEPKHGFLEFTQLAAVAREVVWNERKLRKATGGRQELV